MEQYEVLGKIGQGGTATIFVVAKRDDRRRFVLKRIPMSSGNTPLGINPRNEVSIMQHIPPHPCICQYHSSFTIGNGTDLCIIMEHYEKGDVNTMVQQCKQAQSPLPEGIILSLAAQIILALDHIHSHGVAHRDVKTHNLYLRSDFSVVLGDFGVAWVEGGEADTSSSSHGSGGGGNMNMVGTPLTMPPEVLQGDWRHTEGIQFKADMWALGCVLYEMASLRSPFEGRDIHQLMIRVMRGAFAPLPTYSTEFQDLIHSLLQKNPSQRADARELLRSTLLRPYFAKYVQSLQSQNPSGYKLVSKQLGFTNGIPLPPPPDKRDILLSHRDHVIDDKKHIVNRRESDYLSELEKLRRDIVQARAQVRHSSEIQATFSEERLVRLQTEIDGYKARIEKQLNRLKSSSNSGNTSTLASVLKDSAKDVKHDGTRALAARSSAVRRFCEQKLGKDNLQAMHTYLVKRSKGYGHGLQNQNDNGDALRRDLLHTVKGNESLVRYWTYVDELVYLEKALEVDV